MQRLWRTSVKSRQLPNSFVSFRFRFEPRPLGFLSLYNADCAIHSCSVLTEFRARAVAFRFGRNGPFNGLFPPFYGLLPSREFFFILFVFSSNLDIKTSTPCGLCDVSKCHAERSPTVLPTTRFSPERYVGRLSGASNKGWFVHLRLLTTEFVKTSCDLSRRENVQWDTCESFFRASCCLYWLEKLLTMLRTTISQR